MKTPRSILRSAIGAMLAVFLMSLFVTPLHAQAPIPNLNFTVTVDSASGFYQRGNDVFVTIALDANTPLLTGSPPPNTPNYNVIGYQIALSYDPTVLSYAGVNSSIQCGIGGISYPPGWSFQDNAPAPGGVALLAAWGTTPLGGSGCLRVLKFKVLPNALVGACSSPLSVVSATFNTTTVGGQRTNSSACVRGGGASGEGIPNLNFTVTVDSASGFYQRGNDVFVTIALDANTPLLTGPPPPNTPNYNVLGYRIALSYDPTVLSYAGVNSSIQCGIGGISYPPGWSFQDNVPAPGGVALLAAWGPTPLGGSGCLRVLKFKVLPNALVGACSPLSVVSATFNTTTVGGQRTNSSACVRGAGVSGDVIPNLNFTVTVDSASGFYQRGNDVFVTIALDANTPLLTGPPPPNTPNYNVLGYRIALSYDPTVLSYAGVNSSIQCGIGGISYPPGWSFQDNAPAPGGVALLAAAGPTSLGGSGCLRVLKFKVLPNALVGACSPLSVASATFNTTTVGGRRTNSSACVRGGGAGVSGEAILIALARRRGSETSLLVRFPDLRTGVGETVGPLGDCFEDATTLAVLRQPPARDRVFAVADDWLLELDPTTGAAARIGRIGFNVRCMAFQPHTDVLFGVNQANKLIRIDISTGRGSIVTALDVKGDQARSLTFHPDGRAFVLVGRSPRIRQIDVSSGRELQRWRLHDEKLESLAWSLDGERLYSTADRGGYEDLVSIDLRQGIVSFVSPAHSGYGDIEALGWVNMGASASRMLKQSRVSSVPSPSSFGLSQNVPNPFNPTTRIDFELVRKAETELSIFDVSGRRVATLVKGPLEAGKHQVTWSGASAVSGIYFCVLRSGTEVATRRLVLVK